MPAETTAESHDITSRADIVQLVDAFYGDVRGDRILGPIFDDVAHVEWERHLPKMYDFWETVLFGRARFHGNPLAAHLELARRVPLGESEFGRWLELFHGQVDTLFSGPLADTAKMRASRIATVMQHHIATSEGSLPTTA